MVGGSQESQSQVPAEAGESWIGWLYRRYPLRQITAKISFVLLVLMLRVALDASYVLVLSEHFLYHGLYLQVNAVKLFESYLLTALLCLLVPATVRRPSDFLLILLLVFPLVPTLAIYGLRDESRAYTYMMLVAFIVIRMGRRIPLISVDRLRHGRFIALTLAIGGVLVALGRMVGHGGLNHFNLDIDRVYEVRAIAAESVNTGIFAYVNIWAFKVFNVALVAWALHVRRFVWLCIFFVIQLLLFGLTAHKSVIVFPFLVVGLYFMLRRGHVAHWFIGALLGMILTCTLVALLFNYLVPASFLVRRALFVPAHLNFAYYEFFSQAGYVRLSSSLLAFVYDYPFPYPPARMISEFLTGYPDIQKNNGFLATSYMHFGFAGMLVYAFIVGILLRMVDAMVVKKLPIWFGLSLVIVPFVSLFTSADLSTVLLTHGLLPSLILVWLFGAKESPYRFVIWSRQYG